MDILKNIDILLERSNDLDQRSMAIMAFRVIRKALRSGRGNVAEERRSQNVSVGGPGFYYEIDHTSVKFEVSDSDWEKISNHFKNVYINIKHLDHPENNKGSGGLYEPEKVRFMGEYKTIGNITLYVEIDDIYDMSDNPADVFDKHEDIFIHEYIHHLDQLRTEGGAFEKGHDGFETKSYYNSPQEMNAYFQEGASKIHDNLTTNIDQVIRDVLEAGERGWSSLEDALDMSKKFDKSNIDEYLDKHFNQEWIDNLTDENLKKVKSRIYDIRYQLRDYARSELKDKGLLRKAEERDIV